MNLYRVFIRYLSPAVLYLDKVPVYLDLNGNAVSDDMPKQSCRIMILGKHAYYETLATFPFKNLKEIKAAVALDQTAYSPFATNQFYLRIISRKQENTLVNLWFVRPSMVEAIQQASPWIIIPETAMWTPVDTQRPCLYAISRKDDQLMIHLDGDGAVRSSLAPKKEEVLESFQKSLGPDGQNCPIEQVTSYQEYLRRLVARLGKMSTTDIFPFLGWQADLKNFNAPFIRYSAIGLVMWALLYGSIWIMLPYWKNLRLMQENEKLSANLGEVLNKQAQIESIQNEIKKLSGPVEAYTPKVPLFNMLYETISKQAVITHINVAGNRVEISGLSPQASEVLSALSVVNSIDNVQLTAPLKKDEESGKELFTLSFLTKPYVVIQPAHSDLNSKDGG